jgi:hypothetical protein
MYVGSVEHQMNVDHPLSLFLTFADLTIIMQGKAGYPYWYFGTDGATAFDPADANITGKGARSFLSYNMFLHSSYT